MSVSHRNDDLLEADPVVYPFARCLVCLFLLSLERSVIVSLSYHEQGGKVCVSLCL